MYTHTHTHTHNEMIQSLKKNEILPSLATYMDLKGIMLNEISQTENDKCQMISLKCGIKKESKQIIRTETDS